MVQVDSLTKTFQGRLVVDSVSFSVCSGEILGIVGSNGAGKTTTLRMLAGILQPTKGSVVIGDGNVSPFSTSGRRCVGYMSQYNGLYINLTASQNIAFHARIHGVKDRSFVEDLINRLGIQDLLSRRVSVLSGGQRQKVALACAILHKPPLVLLDEPTSGVDPVSRRGFWEVLYELSKDFNAAIVVSTHYLEEAERCHRICVLHNGQALALGLPSELIEKYAPKVNVTRSKPLCSNNNSIAWQKGSAWREVIVSEKTPPLEGHIEPGGIEDMFIVLIRMNQN